MEIIVGIGVTIPMLHAPKVRAYMLIIVGIGVTIPMLHAPQVKTSITSNPGKTVLLCMCWS